MELTISYETGKDLSSISPELMGAAKTGRSAT
jgi:hypothetical protein